MINPNPLLRQWYQKDAGKTILYGDPVDVAKHHPEATPIPDRPDPNFIWDGSSWTMPVISYAEARVKNYPSVGDQLDAILKYFVSLGNISQLSTDLQEIIKVWQAVKAKFPKI